jgi:hypothetical protein
MRWKLPSLRTGKEFERRKLETDRTKLSKDDGPDVDDELNFDHNILFEDRFDKDLDGDEDTGVAGAEVGPLQSTNQTTNTDESSGGEHEFADRGTHEVSDSHHSLQPPQLEDEENSLQSYGPGWRIEFRPMEVQLTDYENAAFAIFTVLLTRCIATQGHNFYLPMSLVEENMKRAQLKDAVLNQKFWMRRNAIKETPFRSFEIPSLQEVETVELTMDEIFHGEKTCDENSSSVASSSQRFRGLIPMLIDYINSLGCDDRVYLTQELLPYFSLLSEKAKGKLPTTAHWIRKQLIDFNNGSHEITPESVNLLLSLCEDIGMGRKQCPELYGHRQHHSLMSFLSSSPSQNDSSPDSGNNHNRLIVQNLDEIDEEDLMFTNYSTYLRPESYKNELENHVYFSSSRDQLEMNQTISFPDQQTNITSTITASVNASTTPVVVTRFEKIKNFMKNVFQRPFFLRRKKRNKEEKIRF